MTNANIHFLSANVPLVQFLPSPHHFIFCSVLTLKNDDVSMPEAFMHGHSCAMTFVYLKVHNGLWKFSVG